MQVFVELFTQLIPLYLLIFLGFIAGRALKIEMRNIGLLMMYIIAPLVFFDGIARTEITLSVLSMPLVMFLIASSMCLLFLKIAKRIWSDSRANVLGLMAGNGNLGYFGLPIALMLFDETTVGIYITAIIGCTIFESSVGFFVTAKGNHTAKEAFEKLLKLPTIYAFLAGVFYSLANLEIPEVAAGFFHNMRGAYTILGMMIIGLGLSTLTKLPLSAPFISLTFLARFVCWPLIALGLIYLDKNYIQFFNQQSYNVLMLTSLMPVAANSVVLASVLKAYPEKVATTVLLTTIFALVYIPFMVSYLF